MTVYCQVWNTGTVHYYAGQVAEGRRLPAGVVGEEDDPLQMGGDFILNRKEGRLELSHPSAHPRDRPQLEQILVRLGTAT